MTDPTDFLAVAGADSLTRILSDRGDEWVDSAVCTGWWPAWRPGRREYAVSRVETRRDTAHAALHLQGIDGGDIPIPGSMSAPPALIAERLAHYALWDPTGRAICYVMPSGRTLAARLWRPGEPEAETLTGGTPIFPSWSPDGRRLVLHYGDHLMSVDQESGEQQQLSTNAMGFRTAAISSDGELTAFAEASAQGTALLCHRQASDEPTEAARFDGGVALSFRPGTRELTVAVTTGAEAGVFRDLYVLDPDRPGEPERLIHGPMLAYWWAPTGDRLAVLVPAYTGDGRYQLRFHDPSGQFLRAMEPLTLSPDSRTMVSFFDQFALSHRPWSPDGRRFAFAGRVLTDSIPASFADGQLDAVLVADTVAGGPWRRVGMGFGGFFPPREVNGG